MIYLTSTQFKHCKVFEFDPYQFERSVLDIFTFLETRLEFPVDPDARTPAQENVINDLLLWIGQVMQTRKEKFKPFLLLDCNSDYVVIITAQNTGWLDADSRLFAPM